MPKQLPKTCNAFARVFTELKVILAKHANELVVAIERSDYYYLNTTKEYKKRPMLFGAVKIGKQYVSYHLMPVYGCPELVRDMSPELRKRMQGKACFNFKEVDAKLFKELDRITTRGLELFKRGGYA